VLPHPFGPSVTAALPARVLLTQKVDFSFCLFFSQEKTKAATKQRSSAIYNLVKRLNYPQWLCFGFLWFDLQAEKKSFIKKTTLAATRTTSKMLMKRNLASSSLNALDSHSDHKKKASFSYGTGATHALNAPEWGEPHTLCNIDLCSPSWCQPAILNLTDPKVCLLFFSCKKKSKQTI
jgi:hypothetical protein